MCSAHALICIELFGIETGETYESWKMCARMIRFWRDSHSRSISLSPSLLLLDLRILSVCGPFLAHRGHTFTVGCFDDNDDDYHDDCVDGGFVCALSLRLYTSSTCVGIQHRYCIYIYKKSSTIALLLFFVLFCFVSFRRAPPFV